MKALLLLAILSSTLTGRAQTQTAATTTGPNPQYLNTIYYWASDTLQSLEKTSGQLKTKMRALGFGGVGSNYVIDGARSAVRIKAGSDTRFAVKLSGMMDPSSLIKLYRLDPQKKSREISMTNQSSKDIIDCNVQKSGNDVYILVPSIRLTPGEYGFQNAMMMNNAGMGRMSYTFFAFGVDQ